MKSRILLSLIISLAVLGFGCRSSHIIVGKVRQPTRPEDVKIYLKPPTRYEEIAIVESDSVGKIGFSAQGHINAALERMKRDAAKLGANGIILTGSGTVGSVTVGTGVGTTTGSTYTGTGIATTGPGVNKAVSGVAIWSEGD